MFQMKSHHLLRSAINIKNVLAVTKKINNVKIFLLSPLKTFKKILKTFIHFIEFSVY